MEGRASRNVRHTTGLPVREMRGTRQWARPLIVFLLLLLAVGGGWAQPTRESVRAVPAGASVRESLRPIDSPLESIIGDPSGEWVNGKAARDLYNTNFVWGATEGLDFARSYSQKRIDAKGAAFNTAVKEETNETLRVKPFDGTSVTYSRLRTETMDLGMMSLGASEVQTFGLTQSYGNGDTGGSLSFSRKLTDTYKPNALDPLAPLALGQTVQETTMKLTQGFSAAGQGGKFEWTRNITRIQQPNQYANEQATDALRLNMGLWRASNFTGLYERTESNRASDKQVQHRAFGITQKLRNGEAALALDNTVQRVGGVETDTLARSLKVPVSVSGRVMNFAYDSKVVERADSRVGDARSAAITTKLHGQDAVASWKQDFTVKSPSVRERSVVQSLKLPIHMGGTVSMFAFDTNTLVRNETDILSDVRNLDFASKLAGRDVKANWSRNLVDKGGQDQATTKMAYTVPFSFLGSPTSITYTSEALQFGTAVQKKTRNFAVSLPLTQLQKGAAATYSVAGTQAAGKPMQEVRTASLIMPFSFRGQAATSEFARSETEVQGAVTTQFTARTALTLPVLGRGWKTENQYIAINQATGAEQDQMKTRITIPFKSGNAVVLREHTEETDANGSKRETRVVTLNAPKILLGSATSLQADLQIKDSPALENQQTTHAKLETKPLPQVTLAADYTVQDVNKDTALTQQQLDASCALTGRLSLNARYLEREQLDKSPFVQRTMVVQQKPASEGDMRLRAAFTSTDDGKTDGELMKVVELGVGSPKTLGVNVAYQEYDEAKLTSLGEPTIKVGLAHGDANSMQVTVGYEDQKSRPAPLRNYGIGIPLGETFLRLGFSENALDPRDPKQQRLRLAEVYDANLTRKLGNDLGLDLGYRYLDYPDNVKTPEDVQQWFQVKLTGGKADRGGAVQFAYASGDFVELNKDKPQNTATSVMSLNFERKWSDAGSLSLKLNRTNMPSCATDQKDTYEGRLQFDYKF